MFIKYIEESVQKTIIHPNYLYMQGDITNLSSIEDIVKLTKEKFGKMGFCS